MKHNNLYFGASLLAVSSIATACNGPTEGNIWIDNITMKLE